MSSRRKSRECALQLLFQLEINRYKADQIARDFWKVHPIDPETREYAEFLFRNALEKQEVIDSAIDSHSDRWKISRMAGVDRNVLRIAVTELLSTETPSAVVLDEAIEIARRFSTAESAEFVNGVLDAILKEVRSVSSKPESYEI